MAGAPQGELHEVAAPGAVRARRIAAADPPQRLARSPSSAADWSCEGLGAQADGGVMAMMAVRKMLAAAVRCMRMVGVAGSIVMVVSVVVMRSGGFHPTDAKRCSNQDTKDSKQKLTHGYTPVNEECFHHPDEARKRRVYVSLTLRHDTNTGGYFRRTLASRHTAQRSASGGVLLLNVGVHEIGQVLAKPVAHFLLFLHRRFEHRAVGADAGGVREHDQRFI